MKLTVLPIKLLLIKVGLKRTYDWMNNEMNKRGSNISRFTKP